jgi:hypothetical protein
MRAPELAVLSGALCFALAASGASLRGVIKDPQGLAVADSVVTLQNALTSEFVSTATNSAGRFSFPNLDPGLYLLRAGKSGFEIHEGAIEIGRKDIEIEIELQIRSVATTVEVRGKRSPLANSDPNYLALRSGKLRGEYVVHDVTLERDTATFRLRRGSFSFLPPVLGRVVTGVFVGEGTFSLNPASRIGAEHLKSILNTPNVQEDFTELVVYFSDDTFAEIQAHSEKGDSPLDRHEKALDRVQSGLRKRTDEPTTRLEDRLNGSGAPNLDAELLAEIYSPAERGSFRAFIRGRKHPGLRFLLEPGGVFRTLSADEEVAVLNFNPPAADDGIWYLAHRKHEYPQAESPEGILEDKRVIAARRYRIVTSIAHSTRLTATCELSFEAIQAGARVISFSLLPDLRVSRVALDGREVPYIQEDSKRDGGFYIVTPEPLEKGREYKAQIEYEGGGAIRTFVDDYRVDPETAWYPKANGSRERAAYDLTFIVPAGMGVVSVGKLAREWREGSSSASQWVSEAPLPFAAFNYGVYDRRTVVDEVTGVQFDAYTFPQRAPLLSLPVFFHQNARIALTTAQNAVRLCNHWFGPLSYSRMAVVQTRAALAFAPMLVSMDGFFFSDEVWIRGKNPMREVLPHAVSRQWWGAMLTPRTFHDEWLTAGFAELSAALYLQNLGTYDAYVLEAWRGRRWSISQSDKAAPLWLGTLLDTWGESGGRYSSPDIDAERARMVYMLSMARMGGNIQLGNSKAGMVLHMLRCLMFDPVTGDRDFIDLLHDFVSKHAGGNVGTGDFKAAVERHMKPFMDLDENGRMDWFFNEWIFGTEIPSYRLEYRIENAKPGEKPALTGVLTQSGVSPSFKMYVPVYGKFDGKWVLVGSVSMIGSSTREFRLRLPRKPAGVSIDASVDILAGHVEVTERP